jgi:hypothetical protein
MKNSILENESAITTAFEGTNFGDEGRTANQRKILVCEAVLKKASGYSCGSTITRILRDLGLAYMVERTGQTNLTALGRRHIWDSYQNLIPLRHREKN